MKVSRIEKRNMSYIENLVSSRIADIVYEITNSEKTYLDEIYRIIDTRIYEVSEFGTVDIDFIEDGDFVESQYYNTLLAKSRSLSEMSLTTLSRTYSELQAIFDTIYSKGESITTSLKAAENVVYKIEANVKRGLAIDSIKDEETILESFLNKDHIDTSTGTDTNVSSSSQSQGTTAILSQNYKSLGANTLGFDFDGGYLTLYPVSSTLVPYSIDKILINKPKGSITKPINSRKTMDFISNGYFNNRMLSTNPVFENEEDKDTGPVNDSDLTTSYKVEYNSVSPDDSLVLSMDLIFEEAGVRVDKLNITLDPGEKNGVLSTDNILPYISKIIVNETDITQSVLDNSISIRNTKIGEIERGFNVSQTSVYPTASLNIGMTDVKKIRIELTSDIPQVIYYPEKVLLNSSKQEFYRFNYFETLIMDDYESPEDHPDPAYMYTIQELDLMQEILDNSSSSYNEQIKMNRFFIYIKDIEIYSNVYSTSGTMSTTNLNSSDRDIAAVEIYSNEVIPEGTSIRYFISTDKSVWYEISPMNREDTSELPTRVVYGGIEPSDSDEFINTVSAGAYLKIDIYGSESISPYIKSYVARIKLR